MQNHGWENEKIVEQYHMKQRETKYRAWLTAKELMLPIYEITFGQHYTTFRCKGHSETLREDGLKNSRSAIKMLFIGLTDKNGKEIYNGDVVQYKAHDGYLLKDFVAEVFWKDVQWSLGRRDGKMNDVDLAEVDCLDEDLLAYLEVIGNIFENPKLVK